MPLEPTFIIPRPEIGDTQERLLAKILRNQTAGSVRGTLLASAARTASTSSSNFDWSVYSGVILFLNITAASGTGGLVIFPEYQDPVSLAWNRVFNYPTTAARLTLAGLQILQLGIALGTQSGGVNQAGLSSSLLSSAMRITVNHGDATSYTYSLAYELIP
jgi:hypothetical protein